jgi:GT2 family glycosyltransferase/peptidoglycan/xylan/chitin deacetylase (PgdA/CDA1 family)
MIESIASPLSPRLSVVVPTYQRRDMLARTLESILDQKLADGAFEVVVVVDGSTDGTQEMLGRRFADQPIKVVETANAGPAAARNAGIRASSAGLVLFLDDDVSCPPNLLAAHLAAHEGKPPRVAFGPVLGAGGRTTAAELTRLALEAYYTRMRDEWHPDTSPVAYVAPNTSVPRDALLMAEGFDSRFAHAHEDADLGLRLRAMDLPFEYLPDAPVYESYSKSAQDLASRDADTHGRGEVLLCRRHPVVRRHSFLSSLGAGGLLRRLARQAIARSPLPPDWLLRPLFETAERLPGRSLRRPRLWLLSRRGQATRLRAACAAAGGWSALDAEFGRRCTALLYHHVGPPPPGMPPTLTTTPQRFARQMQFLHERGFTLIAARRWLDWLERGSPLPAKPCVLTFDDAYADLAEHAFPILRRYGFGATVFVVTSRIGGSNDWDASPGMPAVPLLDREQLRTWCQAGIEFGAHSRTHPRLDSLSPGDVHEQVHGGRFELEAVLEAPVRTFAYPFGITTPAAAAEAARTYGLSFGCTEGINTLRTDPHDQRRSMVQPSDTRLDLELRARIGWSPIGRARAAVKLRSRLRAMVGRR